MVSKYIESFILKDVNSKKYQTRNNVSNKNIKAVDNWHKSIFNESYLTTKNTEPRINTILVKTWYGFNVEAETSIKKALKNYLLY